MTQQALDQAKDPDLPASLQAIKRAADMARRTAIQTGTGIVIVEGQKIVHVPAQALLERPTESLRTTQRGKSLPVQGGLFAEDGQ